MALTCLRERSIDLNGTTGIDSVIHQRLEGARQRHDNNWLYISHSRINCRIISASFSGAGKSKWAASAPLRDKIYDRLSPNQTNCSNTLPSLYIQELRGVFFLPPCALFIMLHEGTFFSVVDMRGSWVFHVEHGAAPAGSLGTHSEYQVLWRHYSTTLFINSHAPMVTQRQKHKDAHTWNSSRTHMPALQKIWGMLYALIISFCTINLILEKNPFKQKVNLVCTTISKCHKERKEQITTSWNCYKQKEMSLRGFSIGGLIKSRWWKEWSKFNLIRWHYISHNSNKCIYSLHTPSL